MKRIITTLIMATISLLSFSQSGVNYSYDNAGNRTKRGVVAGTRLLKEATLMLKDTIPKDSIEFQEGTDAETDAYEDSIVAALYPMPTIEKIEVSSENMEVYNTNNKTQVAELNTVNTHVPMRVSIDTNKSIGEIPIQSGTTSIGAKTYTVPIMSYPGINGFEPNLAFTYNSLAGNGIMGMGWSLSGASTITRANKNIYYDVNAKGISQTSDDAFLLDGVRLLKLSSTSTAIKYQTEQGNIRVKAVLSGTVIKYFIVQYPNGNTGIFGNETTSTLANKNIYPLTVLTDVWGNKIEYTYLIYATRVRLTKVSYNNASVEFQYASTRNDPILGYSGGEKYYDQGMLNKVICKFGSMILGTYELIYSIQNHKSFITQINYQADGESFNPLKFYYGEGITSTSYTTKETQLIEWYVADNPKQIKLVKGKFDYFSGADGLISLPNLNPYWEHISKTHVNKYSGDEKIFLYTSLTDEWATPMPNLMTEKGFVDIFCADLVGKQEEYIIKVNNTVVNKNDQLTFHVYQSSLYSGLSKKYTRTFNFPTVVSGMFNSKGIHPKFFYTGDFNGDGKMEVMAVSSHQPFGKSSLPSMCYIFDLENNRLLYSGQLFPYIVNFMGLSQTNGQDAFNKTDRLFICDYDGDGKSDICLINDSGIKLYTFDVSGSTLTGRLVGSYSGFNKSTLVNRDVLPGEFNGDGLTDLLISPALGSSSTTWVVLNSKGNGNFESSSFAGTTKDTDWDFMLQDVNGDGMTDLIKYGESRFHTYLCRNNSVDSYFNYTNYTSKSALAPTNIVSHNTFNQLVSLKLGKVTKFSFPRNEKKESMMTGMVNSYGFVEKNTYSLLTGDDQGYSIYTKGSGAVFPYINIYEPLPVLAANQAYQNGSEISNNRFYYTNAVVHRQGLGFRGFGKIVCYTNKGTITNTFDPYKYGILTQTDNLGEKRTYTHSFFRDGNKLVKLLVTGERVEDKSTLNTINISSTYDSFGFPTQIVETFSDGSNIKTINLYQHESSQDTYYRLGFVRNCDRIITRNGSTHTETRIITANLHGYPITENININGSQCMTNGYGYDHKGNLSRKRIKYFQSDHYMDTQYTYDTYGRLLTVTEPNNRTTTIAYNSKGRVSKYIDHAGNETLYAYDSFGRVITTTFPESSVQSLTFAWSSAGTNGLYSMTSTATGRPTQMIIYDALGREVRKSETRFNGVVLSVDKLYDSDGRLQKESLPFSGTSPSMWNTFSYDSYDRLLTITEASGKRTTHSYSGLNHTVTEKNVSTKRTYDPMGSVVSVTDPGGTIIYNLRADGQPSSIVTPGNIVTSMGYDNLGRQTSLTDPSSGTTTYEYDNSGNLSKETDANGKIIRYNYDAFNRITQTINPEFTINYVYNIDNKPTSITATNGTSKEFTYDSYGRILTWRENIVDGKWLKKEFTYGSGNISSVKYTSQTGVLATENYLYSNGYISEIKLNNSTTIYKLTTENVFGQPKEIQTGSITHKYDYSAYGMHTGRSAVNGSTTYQNFSYAYDNQTYNMTSRTDNRYSLTENFVYDNMNRLTSHANKTAGYDIKGNITQKSEIGSFDYTNTAKPYAISGVTLNSTAIPQRQQSLTYTSFQRPGTIMENGYMATFIYNCDYNRVKMQLTRNGNQELTRYYMGSCYEIDQTSNSTTEKLYLAGNYYSAPAVYVKDSSGGKLYYILRDHLGSITQVISSDGTTKQTLSYDAWGRLRNPSNHTVYAPGSEPALFLGRGYTGHEHLPQFGLVNMNARLYDPALGRFLAPDPLVNSPDYTQGFNRYSYAMNNPLSYIDRDGESVILIGLIIAGAYIGGVAANGGELNPFKWDYSSFTTYLGIGFGAAFGYVAGYGVMVPGAVEFIVGASTPHLSAAVSLYTLGAGTDWKFNFRWSTSAGGGGSVGNGNPNIKDSANKAIEEARWDFSAFEMAAPTLFFFADDFTVVGIANDFLILGAYTLATYHFINANAHLLKKQWAEMERILSKPRPPAEGYAYALVAASDGLFINVRNKSAVYLKTGDVYKYGETTMEKRYSDSYLNHNNLKMKRLHYGNKESILIYEKIMLYGYYFEHGQLPPGNHRFK